YKSMEFTFHKDRFLTFNKIMTIFGVVLLAILFLPWTQIVQGRGYVTALSPGQRSQSIESAIAGRIEKWYVKEGQIVRKGDTILYISEVTDK
ncbi:biotin/lipoyl-binding protein, partial [Aquimarina celericrescens]|nr:biotin/lipoyl-binding protein [Aquimarina celericrescens]